jgi:ribose 5-phosphate isomerase B
MKVIVSADHRGYETKQKMISHLTKIGYQVFDADSGGFNPEDDFPVIASNAVNMLKQEADAKLVLICGSGQGMVMAANRHKGIRAGLGWSRQAARNIRNDEDANTLALPSELYEQDSTLGNKIVEDFLTTPFANAARFKRRNKELDNIT